jgi:hypothetical protein
LRELRVLVFVFEVIVRQVQEIPEFVSEDPFVLEFQFAGSVVCYKSSFLVQGQLGPRRVRIDPGFLGFCRHSFIVLEIFLPVGGVIQIHDFEFPKFFAEHKPVVIDNDTFFEIDLRAVRVRDGPNIIFVQQNAIGAADGPIDNVHVPTGLVFDDSLVFEHYHPLVVANLASTEVHSVPKFIYQ